MAVSYTGRKGKNYTIIEPALGKGGEGSVYRIQGMPDYVIKIFIDKHRTETRHRKLLAMIATPLSAAAMQQVTWPIDVVYKNGSFYGYIMPALKNGEDLNVIYSDKYICTLSEKIVIAKNLCAAVNAVNEAGQACGDLNPKNISVDPSNARVTLVDTDSYHITEANGSRTYRCEVGLPEYLPKEIQDKMKNGVTLSNARGETFSKYTDWFALAVHIFALLMNGCHPFACGLDNNYNINPLRISQPSVAAPQPIANICNVFFPFYHKKPGLSIPKYAPEFNTLPKHIQDLFVRAFTGAPNQRPSPVEWYKALTIMQQNLKICSSNKTHMFASHNKTCPWCEIDKRFNHNPNPNSRTVPKKTSNANTNNIQTGNTKNLNNTLTNKVNNLKKKHASKPVATIKRSSWPMWLLFILSGCVSGPPIAYYLAIPLIDSYLDIYIPPIIGCLVLLVLGGISGAVTSYFTQEKYQTADKAWPWLLMAPCVPVFMTVATALIAAAIGLVVGVVYIALVILMIAAGIGIVAACCGGG